MIDAEFAVFDKLATAFDDAYPNGSRYSEVVESPTNFPCMTAVEIDNSTYVASLDSSNRENHAWVTYEISVYSNLTAGAKFECKNIIGMMDSVMDSLGFTRLFCN